MEQGKRPNFLIRLWLGFWRGLTAFRIAVFNIVFLIVLALVIKLIVSPADRIRLEEQTTLVIAPQGAVVEQHTGEPLERFIDEAMGRAAPETRLRDILAALKRAREDDRIAQVLINTDQLWALGPGMQRELRDALAAFRTSGKRVVAYGGYFAQSQYFLASLADEVWLDPDGIVFLEGYGAFRNYFREGLEDKLEVDINLFRVGEYKSAVEPFIRDDMSEEDREANRYFIGSLWQDYLEAVAMQRGMPVEVLAGFIDNMAARIEAAGGDLAALALEAGLVDRLVSRPEARAELARRGAPDDDHGFRQIHFLEYLKTRDGVKIPGDEVGVVVAQGVILDGHQSPGTIGADSTAALLNKAARDDRIKAVVFRVDSPGGSAFASEVIRREMTALRDAGKPVIVSMGNVAASGGYWISMGADEVWAYPTTITGSIGIFGLFPTLQDTLAKIGVYTDGVGTTPLAGAFRGDRPLPEEARRILQAVIENGYDSFINLVAEHRQMTPQAVDAVGQGRVWSGSQAQQRGLVDQLGTLEDAIAAAARHAGLGDEYRVGYVEPELGAFESLLAELTGQAIAKLDIRAGGWADLLPRGTRARIENDLKLLSAAVDGGRPAVMAHCLCAVP